MTAAWCLLATLALLLTLGATLVTWARARQTVQAALTDDDLAITVMKPMAGLDPRLEENLETFAHLKAPPSFEVLLCLGSEHDAALPVARRFVEKYPERFRLHVGAEPHLGNAKMAQLVHAWPDVKNPLVWVSESNVETSQAFFEALAHTWKQANAGGRKKTLVHAPLVAVGGTGIGAALERMHLSSLQNPSHELARLRDMHAVVGKTEFFHRDDMTALGGLERFANYLGEDYLMGVAFAAEGQVVRIVPPTRNVLGHLTARAWFDRHTRWAVMRKTLVPGTFFLLEPQVMLVWPLAFWLAGVVPFELVLAFLGARVFIDTANWSIQTKEWPRLTDALLVPVKDWLLFAAWAMAVTTFHVKWRADRAIRLGPGSQVLSRTANPSSTFPHWNRTSAIF